MKVRKESAMMLKIINFAGNTALNAALLCIGAGMVVYRKGAAAGRKARSAATQFANGLTASD
ncbi:MAG: hypothetical protein A3C15_04215 [Candidatus Magasanikbacteria bacterium RIFCSPHIGHO2_02_FULL_50_9b]|uniref:Uncharacterized protein n=1 Tax=Candidatus Magasanikbacteria bacterium RIFCSPHIGHO2_02_FULL_50_9b TaxID=1798682 RepID=A0A1F6M7D1_9BACT|nr:MAG: hypothetical protein A3C15_04215 [Candidatus Magasanikbacteria bacterium RIFCSPHIGHO2_02_FULL_50_9b]